MSTNLVFSEKTYNFMPLHFALDEKIDLLFPIQEISSIIGEDILNSLSPESVTEAQNSKNEKVQVVDFANLYYCTQKMHNKEADRLILWMADNLFTYRFEAMKKAKEAKTTTEE